jgi:hypothetical protein
MHVHCTYIVPQSKDAVRYAMVIAAIHESLGGMVKEYRWQQPAALEAQ